MVLNLLYFPSKLPLNVNLLKSVTISGSLKFFKLPSSLIIFLRSPCSEDIKTWGTIKSVLSISGRPIIFRSPANLVFFPMVRSTCEALMAATVPFRFDFLIFTSNLTWCIGDEKRAISSECMRESRARISTLTLWIKSEKSEKLL
ncbi:hypothetical protein D3C73_759240 [compost metagenome]